MLLPQLGPQEADLEMGQLCRGSVRSVLEANTWEKEEEGSSWAQAHVKLKGGLKEASMDSTESSEAGTALQSCPELRRER